MNNIVFENILIQAFVTVKTVIVKIQYNIIYPT